MMHVSITARCQPIGKQYDYRSSRQYFGVLPLLTSEELPLIYNTKETEKLSPLISLALFCFVVLFGVVLVGFFVFVFVFP